MKPVCLHCHAELLDHEDWLAPCSACGKDWLDPPEWSKQLARVLTFMLWFTLLFAAVALLGGCGRQDAGGGVHAIEPGSPEWALAQGLHESQRRVAELTAENARLREQLAREREGRPAPPMLREFGPEER